MAKTLHKEREAIESSEIEQKIKIKYKENYYFNLNFMNCLRVR